jgi:hypothetical protein
MIKKNALLCLFAGLLVMPLSVLAQTPVSAKSDSPAPAVVPAVAVSTSDATPATPAADATEAATAPTGPPPVPAELIKMAILNAQFDKYNVLCSMWNVGGPCPGAGDTFTADKGGIRTNLAKAHFGLWGMSMAGFDYNFMNPPAGSTHDMLYEGQRPSDDTMNSFILTYNAPHDFQIGVGYAWTESNWGSQMPNAFHFSELFLHQTIGKLKYDIGYIGNEINVYDGFVAGSLASGAMGVKSVIPYQVGMAYSPFPAPTFHVRYDLPKHFWLTGIAQRSVQPDTGPPTESPNAFGNSRDQQGLRFDPKGDKVLYMGEVVYKTDPIPGKRSTYFRATGFYNTSGYMDFTTLKLNMTPQGPAVTYKTAHNSAQTVGLDQQLLQIDKILAYRGLYVNVMAQHAPAKMDLFSQYYQVALYTVGLFKSRPLDIMIVNLNQSQFSRTALNHLGPDLAPGSGFGLLPSGPGGINPIGGTFAYDGSTTLSGIYGLHIKPGVVLSTMFMYGVHPAFAPKIDNSLTGKVALTTFF